MSGRARAGVSGDVRDAETTGKSRAAVMSGIRPVRRQPQTPGVRT
jgi:hypothetical protein